MSSPSAFRERLEDARLVHLDARVVAYHLLGDGRYLELTRLLFAGLRSGAIRGQSSVISLYQLLVEPFRRGEGDRASGLARHLSVVPGLALVPVSARVAVQAAEVRAQLGGKPERAVQIATALDAGADLFLTEDSGLRRVAGTAVMNLEDYL